ncbi:uncharacterized protein [Eurosta solidaginis]|uniref:uncharacterized protein n=1 Tax=Eurosta solidaginis TaxID=178769 RepID=UPI0035308C1B
MCERNALDSVFNKIIESSNNDLTRKRKNDSVTENTMSKTTKNNYYAILDEYLEECNEAFIKFQQYVQTNKLSNDSEETRAHAINNNYNPSTSAAAAEAAAASVTNKQEPKANTNVKNKSNSKNIPPINTFDVESKQIIELIKDGLKITQFKIKEYNQNKIAIYLTNLDDYKRVRGCFEKAKVKYYSYTPKCLKTKTYLLKGLNGNIKCEEILNELQHYQNENLTILKGCTLTLS